MNHLLRPTKVVRSDPKVVKSDLKVVKSDPTGAHSDQVTRLLAVDSHPVVLEGLGYLASREADLRVDWKTTSADDALCICEDCAPDMAVIGFALGDISGLDLVKRVHKRWPRLRILVLSLHDEAFYANCALNAGAHGYVMKSATPKQLIQAIRTVRDGGTYLSETAQARRLDCASSGAAPDVPATFAMLTDREREVFQYIGRGLKKGQIAAVLERSVNTVETHRSNLKKKLKIQTSGELARLAFHCCQNGCA
jgi:DNA-binding NarL/FixJ family response regulator